MDKLHRIERGMANGADAVDSNFQAIQGELTTPKVQQQSFVAYNEGKQWVTQLGKIYRQGNIVIVNYQGKDANSSVGTKIADMPSWAKPMTPVFSSGFEMDGDYHNYDICNVWVTATGELNCQNKKAYTYTNFTLVYMAQ